MDMIIPSLEIKILLESNPLKPRIVVRRLAVLMLSHPSEHQFRGKGALGQWHRADPRGVPPSWTALAKRP